MDAPCTKTAIVPTETRTELPDKTLKIEKWYERDTHTGFDVCADDHCQRYQGITKASTEKVAKAIEETRGLVLMSGNEICDARFSKSCGGATETFENCWAPEHYSYLEKIYDKDNETETADLSLEENAQKWIRQNPEAFCNTTDEDILSQVLNNFDRETTDFYRWKTEYTQKQLSELIAKKSGFDIGSIVDLTPLKRGESGRIVELKITGTKRTIVVGKELEIRKWLSESHLYSSAFVIDKKFGTDDRVPERFILTGAGWGHGVGLCQIGAAVMGEKGYDFLQILQHYFKSADIKKLY
jgi:SpoIID/LytB domain protein